MIRPLGQLRTASDRTALAAHYLKTFGECLAPDFVAVGRGGGFVSSRQAYIDLLADHFKDANAVRYERIPDKIEISSVNLLAAEHGHRNAILPNGSRAQSGTYLAMWRPADAQWKSALSCSSRSTATMKRLCGVPQIQLIREDQGDNRSIGVGAIIYKCLIDSRR
jgi:hypothetical protein